MRLPQALLRRIHDATLTTERNLRTPFWQPISKPSEHGGPGCFRLVRRFHADTMATFATEGR